MKFEELTEKEFDEASRKFNISSFYQISSWAKLKEKNNWIFYYVGVKEDDKIMACALILGKKLFLNKYMYYSPRGILIDYNNKELFNFFVNNIKDYLKEKNGVIFKIDPLIEYQKHDNEGNIIDNNKNDNIINNLKKVGFKHKGFTKGYSEEIQFRWSYALDVTKENIESDMNQRCRRCTRKAEKYPFIIEYLNDNNLNDFKLIMEHTAKRQNHFDRTIEYYCNFDSILGDSSLLPIIYLDRNKFLEDHKEDKLYSLVESDKRDKIPLSAGVFVFDHIQANYVYGGTMREYMPLMAQYKMQMEMIKEAKKRNLSVYDFGGISGIFEEGTPNYGVYEFKKGFGGYVIEYIGEFDLPISKIFYITYNIMYKTYRFLRSIFAKIKK